MRDHIDELIPLVQAETGATMRVAQDDAGADVRRAVAPLRGGAVEPSVIPLPPSEMPTTALAPGGLMGAIAVRQPVGVVACITPYNFPIVNMAGKIGPALAMGNTVVVKPAPQDPLAVHPLRASSSTKRASRPASSTSSPARAPRSARRSSRRRTSTW